ncbi:eclosion hormone-like [Paramacrobiotus metropolitanus]|uniref:eclosion hormone-like n=1 Tax=Paramacrobiotus metropolitanus TaxID=2943436 RepID=UPI0024459D33|nr:eclosion hormone-like [Paramacrobiotus metropolitanus]
MLLMLSYKGTATGWMIRRLIILQLMHYVLFMVCDATSATDATGIPINSIAVCITNCAQCHDLIGNIFDHRTCSKDCVRRRASFLPDCTDPNSIRDYLSLGSSQPKINPRFRTR